MTAADFVVLDDDLAVEQVYIQGHRPHAPAQRLGLKCVVDGAIRREIPDVVLGNGSSLHGETRLARSQVIPRVARERQLRVHQQLSALADHDTHAEVVAEIHSSIDLGLAFLDEAESRRRPTSGRSILLPVTHKGVTRHRRIDGRLVSQV